jgi:hypothetical protein
VEALYLGLARPIRGRADLFALSTDRVNKWLELFRDGANPDGRREDPVSRSQTF